MTDNTRAYHSQATDVALEPQAETHGVMDFLESSPESHLELAPGTEPLRNAADTPDVPLSKFFERPVKIISFQWPIEGPGINLDFDPWSLFLRQARVANRMSNYRNFSGNLNLKFIINGTGFHYGRLLVSYRPLPTNDFFTENRVLVAQDLVEASQRPHVFLDPCDSQGASMRLPFVWYYDKIDLTTNQVTELGDMNIRTLVGLRHATGGTTPDVTVNVFAWLDDVKLSQPTSVNANALIAQAQDEYDGPVSGPASAIAKAASVLSTFPVIAPYARVTSRVAGVTADVAKRLGYCKPIVTDEVKPYKPTFMRLANTSGKDTSEKLSLDPKQELSIDPRIVGLSGMDEMSLAKIASKESYLTSFPWQVISTPETRLFSIAVNPAQYAIDPTATPFRAYHMTPSCFAAAPFKFWRGSMKFRFQIVCSQFHKGRLRISYDPVNKIGDEFNIIYSEIVDISEKTDMTLEVGWGSPRGMLRVADFATNTFEKFTVGSGVTPVFAGADNGIVTVEVLNDLTTPATLVNKDVSVNVFVSAGDDIVFASPSGENFENLAFAQEVSPTLNALVEQAELNSPEQDSATPINKGELALNDPFAYVYAGESVSSVRELIKRFMVTEIIAHQASEFLPMLTTAVLPDFPRYRGYLPSGSDQAFLVVPYNRTRVTYLNWFTPAFACRRGGIRRKYFVLPMTKSAYSGWARCVRMPTVTGNITEQSAGNLSFGTDEAAVRAYMSVIRPTDAGSTMTYLAANPVLEVELPNYTNARFMQARGAAIENGTVDTNYHYLQTFGTGESVAGNNVAIYIEAQVAAADDFSLFYFVSTPIVYGAGNQDP